MPRAEELDGEAAQDWGHWGVVEVVVGGEVGEVKRICLAVNQIWL